MPTRHIAAAARSSAAPRTATAVAFTFDAELDASSLPDISSLHTALIAELSTSKSDPALIWINEVGWRRVPHLCDAASSDNINIRD
jgi:hypothetical protein